jgi:hypothetical protein
MNLFNWERFIEAQLTIPDLKKPSNPKFTNFGPLRGDILLGKIENGSEFKVKGGDTVKIDIDPSVDLTDQDGKFDPEKTDNLKISNSRLKEVLYDVEDPTDKYKISDLVKTVDFSGGGGSSLGTVSTRIMESLQVFVLSLKQNYYPNQILHQTFLLDPKNIERMSSSKDAFAPIEFSEDNLVNYLQYHLTYIKTANKFIGPVGILDPSKKYNFHQMSAESDFMKQLHSTYRRCCTESFGKVINMAKWTPCDIWVVDKNSESEIINQLSKLSRIEDLNNFIDEKFSKNVNGRYLVGVSLKKIASKRENITVVINKETERPKFKLNEVRLSSNPLTKGTDISLWRLSSKYPGFDSISIKSCESKISNIVVEVSGSSSRHGKCSLTQVNEIFFDNGLEQIPTASEIKSKYTKDELLKLVLELDSKLKSEDISSIKKSPSGNRSVLLPNLISKYQSLLFCDILVNSKISGYDLHDRALNSIMYYALSISNKYFECPKYARIVEY